MPIQVSNTWDYWIDLCKINAYEQMLTELKAQKSIQLSSNSPSLLGHCIGPNFFISWNLMQPSFILENRVHNLGGLLWIALGGHIRKLEPVDINDFPTCYKNIERRVSGGWGKGAPVSSSTHLICSQSKTTLQLYPKARRLKCIFPFIF